MPAHIIDQIDDRSTLERVLDAAADLFLQEGFASTPIREIARAAGIQSSALYYYVSRKEGLLHQLCISTMDHLMTEARAALARQGDPMDRVRNLIRAHLGALVMHRVRHVTMLTELRCLSRSHYGEMVALRKDYANLVRSVIEQAQADGEIRVDIQAKYLYLALLNMLNWAVIRFRREDTPNDGQLAGLLSRIYLNGVIDDSTRRLVTLHQPSRLARANARERTRTGRESTSSRLLDAAAELFAKKGFGATTTREIATCLGIQKASLYHHIGSKEELLYGICCSALNQLREDVEAALKPARDPLDRVCAIISAHVESILRDQNKHSVTIAEKHLLSEERRTGVHALLDGYVNLVRSVLLDAQDGPRASSGPPSKFHVSESTRPVEPDGTMVSERRRFVA